MAVYVLSLLVLLAITSHSSATYCVCKDGLSEGVYQKDIDYACGQGADCTPIQEKGVCFSPNTVKDHCNYAVNSYFQRKGQVTGSCDFSGSAITTPSLTSQSSTCVYPSSASPAGTTPGTGTPTITPTTPATGTTSPTGGTTTPATGITSPPGGTTTPATGFPSPPGGTTTTPTTGGNTFGTPPSSIFGLGPTSINPSTDNKAHSKRPFFWAFTMLFSGPLLFLTI